MPRSAGGAKPGDWNLKGKKRVLCACRCCDVVDFREDYEARRVINEELRPATIGDGYADVDLVDYHQPTSDDHGKWEVYVGDNGNIGVISTDFTHDAILYVNGDFESNETKLDYASRIASRLNRTIPE